MMMSLAGYVRQGRRLVRRWVTDPRLKAPLRGSACFLGGLMLSAASLARTPLPLTLGVLCALPGGWSCVLTALGGVGGYRLFWGGDAAAGIIWMGVGLLIRLILGNRNPNALHGLLLPCLAALTVSCTGLALLLLGGPELALGLYLMQILLAFAATAITLSVLRRRDPVMDWLACGLGILALVQIGPTSWSNLGLIAAGFLCAGAPFPAIGAAGLALDLSRLFPVPMTAVLSLAFLLRLLTDTPRWVQRLGCAFTYLICAPLCGVLTFTPAIALGLGGLAGGFFPPRTSLSHRRGPTGAAQVRLEMTAGVLSEMERSLLEVADYPIDEAALIAKACGRACDTCPCRKGCKDSAPAQNMSTAVLHRPLIDTGDLPIRCRKPGRLLLEIRRAQDQFRAIRADRDRQKEYRSAMIQQYRFLSDYLQDLSDTLPRRGAAPQPRFDVQVAHRNQCRTEPNGDRCLWFAGTECRYYVLLCDGMGTGECAHQESREAAAILRQLLEAGYPADHALRSLNSLCALRGQAGAVTVDLAQIDLQTGKITLYKWGAAPSWLLTRAGPEKIGTAATPPGLSVTDSRETVDRLSLRRGEALILLSDGVDGEAAMRRAGELTNEEPGEMASKVLRFGRGTGTDDATAAVIRLTPVTL